MYVFCLHECMYTMCVSDAYGGQKRASGPPKWELLMVVRHHADAENQEASFFKPLISLLIP